MSSKNFADKYFANNYFRFLIVILLVAIVAITPKIYRDIYPKPFISTIDNFKIVFPGPPTTKTLPSTNDGSNGQVTARIYDYLNPTKDENYAVYVTQYSNLNSTSLSNNNIISLLQVDIEELAQSENAKLSNGSTVSFKGHSAVEAMLTPASSSEAPAYILGLLNGKKVYVLIGGGISHQSFNAFTNTFNFLN